ncbi:efflux RND transporter permease subunit, partial [Mycobacterium tuberculosis]|nr:efflux RND transporter permease subunit [Mycobacterium tuberculosis]
SVVCRLQDWDERHRSQQEIVAALLPAFQRIPGVSFFPNNPPSLGQGGQQARPIEFVVQTSGTYDDLRKSVDALLDRVRANPGFVNPDTDLKLNQPQLE